MHRMLFGLAYLRKKTRAGAVLICCVSDLKSVEWGCKVQRGKREVNINKGRDLRLQKVPQTDLVGSSVLVKESTSRKSHCGKLELALLAATAATRLMVSCEMLAVRYESYKSSRRKLSDETCGFV